MPGLRKSHQLIVFLTLLHISTSTCAGGATDATLVIAASRFKATPSQDHLTSTLQMGMMESAHTSVSGSTRGTRSVLTNPEDAKHVCFAPQLKLWMCILCGWCVPCVPFHHLCAQRINTTVETSLVQRYAVRRGFSKSREQNLLHKQSDLHTLTHSYTSACNAFRSMPSSRTSPR